MTASDLGDVVDKRRRAEPLGLSIPWPMKGPSVLL